MTFKNSFAETIFKQKYAQRNDDSWNALAHRLVADVCGTREGTTSALLSGDDQREITEHIDRMRFIPGGRYLYYAGRPFKAYNNCFVGSTKVLTEFGWKSLEESVGKDIKVLSPVDGEFRAAQFKTYGKQKVNHIVFSPVRGNSTITWSVRATRHHHWPLTDGTDTYDLRVGDVVPANHYGGAFDSMGFAHGFMFGDGNSNGQLRLCAEKDKKYLSVFERLGTITYPESAKGDPVVYINAKIDWKSLPKDTDSVAYIASFIRGWLAADGSETAGNKLCSVNREALQWFRDKAPYAGIVITGALRTQTRNVVLGKYKYINHEIYIQNYSYGEDFEGFKVVSITPDTVETVYCLEEPVHHRFVIDHGMDTFNCYLLRAEEDTREEWSNVTWRAMSCLMTGGGIGIDYSRLRASGAPLSRTGGTASGPIPLMYAINEIGRNVMQGGSRRSAIYASLNWQHADIPEFLRSKNWRDIQVGTTGQSLHDIKQSDFNFKAPLDMTNISVNYDDASLAEGLATNSVFLQNVFQALSTGEPGFSFNFGDKQNETLRNACTEVTSEDDSDVCNLGSINMGNIGSLEEFRDIISLASKFLVCGTLRADLPYTKVYQVREKNRRLGLGLMGVHEWLLKRGYRYEINDELRQWLEVYRDESERAANRLCDVLSISKPVAYRAIAPTGSIGILAGTTTGIEPLFAVSYKRRFLTGATKWKYQYVVDGTAEGLINSYGISPDTIETALDLANDPERRIAFQYEVQKYVDMSISSTINIPEWGTAQNNEDAVRPFAEILAKYAHGLRGFTVYPNAARGGQPLTAVAYKEALKHKDVIFEENDICDISGKGGTCGA